MEYLSSHCSTELKQVVTFLLTKPKFPTNQQPSSSSSSSSSSASSSSSSSSSSSKAVVVLSPTVTQLIHLMGGRLVAELQHTYNHIDVQEAQLAKEIHNGAQAVRWRSVPLLSAIAD